jgi:predicted RNA-binding Zn-ribbon protein involved in translation (DUF1610 family)
MAFFYKMVFYGTAARDGISSLIDLRQIMASIIVRAEFFNDSQTSSFRASRWSAHGVKMGGFVKFSCMNCGYTEERIGYGHGNNPEPRLQLYRCGQCKTVGSTWVEGDRPPLCGGCYNKEITLLESKNASFDCPRCDTAARLSVREDTWE